MLKSILKKQENIALFQRTFTHQILISSTYEQANMLEVARDF